MTTELEARNKWCPFVRYHRGKDGAVYDNKPVAENEKTGVSGSPLCIASGCMAWRFKPTDQPADGTTSPIGFCGLAGGDYA